VVNSSLQIFVKTMEHTDPKKTQYGFCPGCDKQYT
jgi:hypothetical protein